MSRPRRRAHIAAGALCAVSIVLLLRRMRHELLAHAPLPPVTMVWMHVTYGAHTAATIWTLHRCGGTYRRRTPR